MSDGEHYKPRLVLITPPELDVVTLAEAKLHLHVEHDDQDDLIQWLIESCVDQLSYLGRAWRAQTWELRLPAFPSYEIDIPKPPLISITSFKYDDTSGTEQTLALTTGYRLFVGQGVPVGKARVAPPYNGQWPVARCDYESVRLRFQAGYPEPEDDAFDPIAAVKARVLLGVGSYYAHREDIVVGVQPAPLPDHILHMLSTFRVY